VHGGQGQRVLLPDVDAVFVDDRQAIRIRILRESEVGLLLSDPPAQIG